MYGYTIVTEAANILEMTELEVFRKALKGVHTSNSILQLYRNYCVDRMKIPVWVNHFCRKVIAEYDKKNPDRFVRGMDAFEKMFTQTIKKLWGLLT